MGVVSMKFNVGDVIIYRPKGDFSGREEGREQLIYDMDELPGDIRYYYTIFLDGDREENRFLVGSIYTYECVKVDKSNVNGLDYSNDVPLFWECDELL